MSSVTILLQCQNFLRFCELAVVKCPNLKFIELVTNVGNGPHEAKETDSWFASIKSSLQSRGVDLSVKVRQTLHDRTIR